MNGRDAGALKAACFMSNSSSFWRLLPLRGNATMTGIMKKRWAKQTGFTIVELLIVIVVIAILAAITVVAYNGIQNRASDSSVQSDLRNIGSKILEYSTINGSLPATSVELTSVGMKVSASAYGSHFEASPGANYNMAYCRYSSTGRFALVAASKSGNVFKFSDGSLQQGVGPMVTIATTCTNNGFSGASNTWFYSNNVWQYGMGS